MMIGKSPDITPGNSPFASKNTVNNSDSNSAGQQPLQFDRWQDAFRYYLDGSRKPSGGAGPDGAPLHRLDQIT